MFFFTNKPLKADRIKVHYHGIKENTHQKEVSPEYLMHFDLSWDNSFMNENTLNWDAAWVFAKFMEGEEIYYLTNAKGKRDTITVSNTFFLKPGMPIELRKGRGKLQEHTCILKILNNTQFIVNKIPHKPIINATLTAYNIWNHATIKSIGHESPKGIKINTSSDNKGVFIHRKNMGQGNLILKDICLNWDFSQDKVNNLKSTQIKLFAIEMVYVPEGEFYVGSGGNESGTFTVGGNKNSESVPFKIKSEEEITIANRIEKLWGTSESGDSRIGTTGSLPNEYPKGFKGFYCMKYEITQGQYKDFLNSLTKVQQYQRVEMDMRIGNYAGGRVWDGIKWSKSSLTNLKKPANRIGIRLVKIGTRLYPNVFACDLNPASKPFIDVNQEDDGEYLSMGQLNWMDLAAFLDWCALRPMTELEFEKSCRGFAYPNPMEFAWASNKGIQADSIISQGTAYESVLNPEANTSFGNHPNVQGALRGGACGVNGLSYLGISDLSGNLWERVVSASNPHGRSFNGLHGDGILSLLGNANVEKWPGFHNFEIQNAEGSGFRGGSWYIPAHTMRVSDRTYGDAACIVRFSVRGGRGVRTLEENAQTP
jgi:formylglycine-generating enzyme required for sulfatase activity